MNSARRTRRRWLGGAARSRIAKFIFCLVVPALTGVGFAPSASAASCDGVTTACTVGDTGPGGGIVFFDAGGQQPWGRYLEAAPANVDREWAWCVPGRRGHRKMLWTSTAIGTGATNTAIIIRNCGAKSAAAAAVAYRGGGLGDWFLPSKDELNELYRQRNLVGGLNEVLISFLWSSSQERTFGTGMAWGQVFYEPEWYQGFDSGEQFANFKGDEYPVRPIRAF